MIDKALRGPDEQDELRVEIEKLSEKVNILIAEVQARPKARRELSAYWMTLLSFIYLIYQVGQDISKRNAPATATHEQVTLAKNEIVDSVRAMLEDNVKSRYIQRSCALHTKPTNRSYCIDSLHADARVAIISVQHEWVNINYIDEGDGMPVTGWVQKKYLSKKKP